MNREQREESAAQLGRRFSDTIRSLRLDRGLTVTEAARRAKITREQWLQCESSPKTMLRVGLPQIGAMLFALGYEMHMPALAFRNSVPAMLRRWRPFGIAPHRAAA